MYTVYKTTPDKKTYKETYKETYMNDDHNGIAMGNSLQIKKKRSEFALNQTKSLFGHKDSEYEESYFDNNFSQKYRPENHMMASHTETVRLFDFQEGDTYILKTAKNKSDFLGGDSNDIATLSRIVKKQRSVLKRYDDHGFPGYMGSHELLEWMNAHITLRNAPAEFVRLTEAMTRWVRSDDGMEGDPEAERMELRNAARHFMALEKDPDPFPEDEQMHEICRRILDITSRDGELQNHNDRNNDEQDDESKTSIY